MKYLVNFEIKEQGFSEIVEAENKEEALDKAKGYLETRFIELEAKETITTKHERNNVQN